MSEAILRAESVGVRYDARFTLSPCSLQLAAGEVLTIYGPNGAGKSTLLLALAGLARLVSGTVWFNGKVIGMELSLLDYHRQTAAVFQEPLLLRGTVRHNVTLGLRLRGMRADRATETVRPWVEKLKIAHLLDRSTRTLSAGEAQRTSLARALVLNPSVLFLDEPFAALDTPTRLRLVGELAEILTERQIATLFVTHDLAEARRLSRRGLVLDAGRIAQEGEIVEMLRQPASARVAEILGIEPHDKTPGEQKPAGS